jgi:hydroxylamine reductase (hybrid-cluster protein)
MYTILTTRMKMRPQRQRPKGSENKDATPKADYKDNLFTSGMVGWPGVPPLPVFLTPNMLDTLVQNFDIMPIATAEEDLRTILGYLPRSFPLSMNRRQDDG